MKNLAIYGLTALMSVAFVGCNDWDEPNPTPQTNAQGAILQTSDITVAAGAGTTGVLDLQAMTDAATMVQLSDLTTDKLAEGYSFAATVQISNDGFAKVTEVPATVETTADGTYTVAIDPAALQTAYYNGISKNPVEGKVQARYALYTVAGDMKARVGGPDTWYGPYDLTVMPYAATQTIETAYYLLLSTDGSWTVADAIKMNHSDVNVYDDPVFSVKIDITAAQAAAGLQWKVIPASTYAAGKLLTSANAVYGPAEDGSLDLTGALVGNAADQEGTTGNLSVSGPYLLTVNLMDGTYNFMMAVEQLYTPGNSNSWNQQASQTLYTNNYTEYQGYAHLNGEFKFTTAPDWNGINYGNGGEDGVLSNDSGAGNLKVDKDGLYWCTANIAALTWGATYIETYGLIGDGTPGGWDKSTPLTPNASFTRWSADVVLTAGQFKFRANNDWDINLGGDMNNLTPGGDNINVPEPGTYTVTLNLTTVPYKCTLRKK